MTAEQSVSDRLRRLAITVVDALPPRVVEVVRRVRVPGLRTAKTVLAAVAAFALAQWLHTSDSPVLAPLTALLVVQLTMFETFASGWERIVSVVAGVLVATVFAGLTGLTWWSLGLVVAVSIIAGRLLRLGPNLMEVPISAMLILAVNGSGSAARGRVVETLIGAAVGVLVNLLIAPPLYIRPSSEAISDLARRMARFSRGLAGALCGEWSREVALSQLAEARTLGDEVTRADRNLARTEESARLNPRGRLARQAQPRLRSTLTALEHAQVGLRTLTRGLLDRTFFVPEEEENSAYSPETRASLASVLDALAVTLDDAAAVVRGEQISEAAGGRIEENLQTLEQRRHRLGTQLLVDPQADPGAWTQHGAVLAAIDRLRVELETALHPVVKPWRPTPLGDKPRQAVRRALTAAARQPTQVAIAGRRRMRAAHRSRRSADEPPPGGRP